MNDINEARVIYSFGIERNLTNIIDNVSVL